MIGRQAGAHEDIPMFFIFGKPLFPFVFLALVYKFRILRMDVFQCPIMIFIFIKREEFQSLLKGGFHIIQKQHPLKHGGILLIVIFQYFSIRFSTIMYS